MAAGKRGTKSSQETAERAPATAANTGESEAPKKKSAAPKKAAASKPATTSKPAATAKAGSDAKPAASKKAASGAAGAQRGSKPNMRSDLREFASTRPDGWSHDEWLGLLDSLRERGHDTSDTETIGRDLERERLSVTLERIPGLGPRKVDALVDRFGTLWSLRQANAEEIASVPTIPRNLAERIVEAVHK
jgi:hypothetical protein